MSTELSTSRPRQKAVSAALWTSWFPTDPHPCPNWARWLIRLARPILNLLGKLTALVGRRRQAQQLRAPSAPVPVLAIGGWILGGSGKTPSCLAIAAWLKEKGHQPGLISRGYGGSVRTTDEAVVLQPTQLANLSARACGEEAWLLAWRLGCPVAIHPDRQRACEALLKAFPETDCILLDDGLSQTSLRPSQRVLVIDDRLLGNERCLPAGPLRAAWPPAPEFAIAHLLTKGRPADQALVALWPDASGRPGETAQPNAAALQLKPSQWVRPQRGPHSTIETVALADTWEGGLHQLRTCKSLWALAGIARPQPFFDALTDLGLPLKQTLALADHAPSFEAILCQAAAETGTSLTEVTLLMTEKDAVKFFQESMTRRPAQWWALRQSGDIDSAWLSRLEASLWPDPAKRNDPADLTT